jgi:hypothetical protein
MAATAVVLILRGPRPNKGTLPGTSFDLLCFDLKVLVASLREPWTVEGDPLLTRLRVHFDVAHIASYDWPIA